MRSVKRSALALAAGLLLAAAAAAQSDEEEVADVMVGAGEDFYLRYCASCHGRDAEGGGPMAPYLKEEPADLTRIAARRGGAFPSQEIAQIIRGEREIGAHGSREMPIWGRRFRESGGTMAQAGPAVRARVLFLVEYLRSVQQPGEE